MQENSPSPAILNQGSMDFILEGNSIGSCPYEYNDMGAYYHGSSAGLIYDYKCYFFALK